MKTDMNGCAVCVNGEESYESFWNGRKKYIQYDYRHSDGRLFSCVVSTLKEARSRRDKYFV